MIRPGFFAPRCRGPSLLVAQNKMAAYYEVLTRQYCLHLMGLRNRRLTRAILMDQPLDLFSSSNPERARRFPSVAPLNGPCRQTMFPLNQQISTIGRGITAEIPLQDEKVAPSHSRILYVNFDEAETEPDCRIFDAGSGAGTFVNDEPVGVGGRTLSDNDRIRVGDTMLVYFLRTEIEADDFAHRLEVAGTRDHLTGLYAKGVFIGAMHREIARARRYFRCLSLLLVHVDHLVEIKKAHGITAANAVIQDVGAIFGGYLRQTDLLARYDEGMLAALLTETDLAGARIVAERMCNAVAEKKFGEPGNPFHVTVSIGVTHSRRPTMSADNFAAHARTALDTALNAGGNAYACVLPPGEPQA